MARKSQVTTEEPTGSEPDETEQLRQQLEEMRGRLSSTESALREERGNRQRAELATMGEQERRIVAEQEACENSLNALSGQADSLEAQIASLADEPGHGAEVAKLNRQMSRVEAQILDETRRKNLLAEQRERAKAQPAPKVTSARPLANGLSTENFSPATQSWLEKHPQAYSDAAYVKRILAHAVAAVDIEGIPADSPEFFSYIEEKTGEKQPARRAAPPADDGEDLIATAESPYSQTSPSAQDGDEVDYTSRNPQPRAAGPGAIASAAPPSRSIPNSRQPTGPKRTPLLSAEERQVANELYASDPNCKTEADRLRRYADSKAFMSTQNRMHFGAAN